MSERNVKIYLKRMDRFLFVFLFYLSYFHLIKYVHTTRIEYLRIYRRFEVFIIFIIVRGTKFRFYFFSYVQKDVEVYTNLQFN